MIVNGFAIPYEAGATLSQLKDEGTATVPGCHA